MVPPYGQETTSILLKARLIPQLAKGHTISPGSQVIAIEELRTSL